MLQGSRLCQLQHAALAGCLHAFTHEEHTACGSTAPTAATELTLQGPPASRFTTPWMFNKHPAASQIWECPPQEQVPTRQLQVAGHARPEGLQSLAYYTPHPDA